jgi:predicted Rdx family selenoprotein
MRCNFATSEKCSQKIDALQEKKITFVTKSIIGLAPATGQKTDIEIHDVNLHKRKRDSINRQKEKISRNRIGLTNEVKSEGYRSGGWTHHKK